jgi:hypothetical protein
LSPRQRGKGRDEVSHDSVCFGLLHTFVVVTTIKIATIALPVLTNDLLDVNEGFLSKERERGQVKKAGAEVKREAGAYCGVLIVMS